MIGLLLLLGLIVIGAICVLASRGGGFAPGPSRPASQEPSHRQAIHHFASGVLPPWR
jgi:hypothetical protein